jgi:hypothetical protein
LLAVFGITLASAFWGCAVPGTAQPGMPAQPAEPNPSEAGIYGTPMARLELPLKLRDERRLNERRVAQR